ncbi:unnamed protein product [Dracunculus medinensis]|uniref:Uncharacterized protein n=1 Tax=Dracunculus medinensis TaxID=318479 RepID=A0A3P7PLN6_DRAME|nr:unnamed protein product [Dracunculus medinensis]
MRICSDFPANIFTKNRYRSKTRMSVVDVWNNETANGNVIIAHNINSWPAILDQLNEPILEKSTIIEGDVLLYKQRKHRNRAIPLMSAPQRIATDRITFKEWLREVAKLRKVIKINVRSTEAIRPVLQYLFAANEEIVSPVVLHANIFRSPRSLEKPVDAIEFLDGTRKYFPEATLSFGWTKNNISELTIHQKRSINWRELFQIFSLIKRVEQPIMISARISVVINSISQLSFVLGIKREVSLLIWSDETDLVDDWMNLISLRSGPYSKQIVFDLHPNHASVVRKLPYKLSQGDSVFDRKKWHRIEFPSPSTTASGIIESNEGVAFIGWSNSFLISILKPPIFPEIQKISSQVRYISSSFIFSKFIIFLGYNGQMSIKNRDDAWPSYRHKSVGQLRRENCYEIHITDRDGQIEFHNEFVF